MSTFDGQDIFGSGTHKIIVDGELVSKKRSAFTGIDGVDSQVMGGRGRPVRITGILRAATVAALYALITAIEVEIKDTGPATLVDNFSVSHTDVELDSIQLTSNIMYSANEAEYIVTYIVTGRQLYT